MLWSYQYGDDVDDFVFYYTEYPRARMIFRIPQAGVYTNSFFNTQNNYQGMDILWLK